MTTINAQILDLGPLTPREGEIVALFAEGHADKVIADKLDISIRTVNAHSANICTKLDIHSASIGVNTAAINNRCWAVSVMIARKLLSVSVSAGVKAVALMLIFNALQLDDQALRARSARVRGHHVSRFKRDA